MAHYKKITVTVLGDGDALKKALIINITGTDLSKLSRRKVLRNIEIYEGDTYEFTCTPDLSKGCEDIKELFAINQHPDMCVLVVEDDFKEQDVKQQLRKLQETTGKKPDQFRVVPPLCYESTQQSGRLRVSTMWEILKELRQLAQRPKPRHPNMSNEKKRHADTSDSGIWANPLAWLKGKTVDREVNLVLLGMSGTGKSATGNTILKKNHFSSMPSSVPVTQECQEATVQIDGTLVHVIDTPDMFDDDLDPSVREFFVGECKRRYETRPHVFLLVMQVNRFTDGERNILGRLQGYFGNRAHERTVLLFTCGADLQRDQMTFDTFLRNCHSELKKIVTKCGGRCVLFENKNSDGHQVKLLMQVVNHMLEEQH